MSHIRPIQLIMNGQARAIEVEPAAEAGAWVVTKMGSPRGQRTADASVAAIMQDTTLQKCEVGTEDGKVYLRFRPRMS